MKDRSSYPTNTIVILLSFRAVFTDGQYSRFSKGLYSSQSPLTQNAFPCSFERINCLYRKFGSIVENYLAERSFHSRT
ncbi:unnamed protein product [Callosobruchus maculatus]|uniref:Uncharacterized protein n=1 Tax=Callosobruchus maculatus TaxID=64391 RepID=A0A653C6V7_CALMS|nr:unnamed protein product [Callosobruchus maculatus]